MLGSYSADPSPRSTEVISDDFPSGMVARGTYVVTSKVVDLDGQVWLGASILPITRIPCQDNGPRSRLEMAAQDCEGLVRITDCLGICGCCGCNVARTCCHSLSAIHGLFSWPRRLDKIRLLCGWHVLKSSRTALTHSHHVDGTSGMSQFYFSSASGLLEAQI